MTNTMKMKAPEGKTSAVIEGHQYNIPKNGVIDVVSSTHITTLRRHGFSDVADSGVKNEIESTNDKERLVEIIEELGGDADAEMKLGKLRRMAREAFADSETSEDEDDDSEEGDSEDEKPAKSRKSKKG